MPDAPRPNPDPSAIQHGYDRWSLVYDHDANPLPALEEPFVREAVGDPRGLAAVNAGFSLEGVGEYAPDEAFAARYPRAVKYVGWPMLVVLRLRASSPPLS